MTSNYILSHWNDPLVQFALNFINEHSYINIRSFNRFYCDEILNDMSKLRSVAIRLGIITRELKGLGIITSWSYRTYKSEYKGNLFKTLEKRLDKSMDKNYLLVEIKNIEERGIID